MILFRSFVVFFFIISFASSEIKNKGWWKNLIFYQIFPRSFMDSNGDGNGDLRGIINRLEHFVDIGVGAIWMSPVTTSPMVDNGYDVSDYYNIDPSFGSLDDFDDLIKKAKELGIRVIIDFVPNHTSDQHKWFINSVNNIGKYKDYYVWREGRGNNAKPPNNWNSIFHAKAWTYNEKRGLWYLHQFEKRQPDLNYNNPAIHREMERILKYWLDKGVNGFRIDAIDYIYEDDRFLDEPFSNKPGVNKHGYRFLDHIYTVNDSRNFDLFASWRKIIDDWTVAHNEEERILMTESYFDPHRYYNFGSHVPFNFKLIRSLNDKSKPSKFKNVIDKWMAKVPPGQVTNWVTGNHDRKRITRRFRKKPDLLIMLVMVLPGIACVYYGDEISMEDNRDITWEDTRDPMACSTNPQTFQKHTRDPCRTPFQWDNRMNADFSTAEKTWLPINKNYPTLNLEYQKFLENSPYQLFKSLSKLKSTSGTLKNGSLRIEVLNNDSVLVVSRQSSTEAIVLLNNFSDNVQTVDVRKYLPGTKKAIIYVSSRGSNKKWGSSLPVSIIKILPTTSIVLKGTINTSK